MKYFLIACAIFALPLCVYADEEVNETVRVAREIAQEFQGDLMPERISLSLDQILQRVLKDNFEIRQAKQALEKASGEKLVFRSRALPKLSVYPSAGRQGHRNETKGAWYGVAGGRFSQPLFEAGIPASWRAGDLGELIARQNLQATVIAQLHAARLAFYDALFQRALILLNKQLGKRLETNLSNEQQRMQAGLSAKGSVNQAKIQKLNLEPQTAEAEANYRAAILQTAVLLGIDLGPDCKENLFLRGPLDYQPISIQLAEQGKYALEHRPDLKLFRLFIQNAGEQRKIAEAGFFPVVQLVVDGEYLPKNNLKNNTSNSARSSDDTQNSEVRIGGTLTWRVVDTGATVGAVMRAQKTKEDYEILLKQMEEDVPRDLSRVAHQLQAEQARIEALQKTVTLAEENLKLVEEQVKLGQSSQLDFLQAQTSLFETKFNMLEGLYRHNVALAELDHVTGRYLQYAEVKN